MKWLWDFLEQARAIVAYEGDPDWDKWRRQESPGVTPGASVVTGEVADAASAEGLLRATLPYLREHLEDCEYCIAAGGDTSTGLLAGKVARMQWLEREIVKCLQKDER